jgi:hypothetical protein
LLKREFYLTGSQSAIFDSESASLSCGGGIALSVRSSISATIGRFRRDLLAREAT